MKDWFHERFFSAKCEIFRLFLLNCEHSSRNNLFEWSQFKRNRRNISHFAEKKRSWNQALIRTARGRSSWPIWLNVRKKVRPFSRHIHLFDPAFSTNYNLSPMRYSLLAWSNSFCRQLVYCADGHGIGGVRPPPPPPPPLATPLYWIALSKLFFLEVQ
jgi:hypothetical protein